MIIDPKEVSIARFHSILLGAVGPRPIAFASTIDEDGNPNLSPFSFFNAFSANPPTLIFSPARRVRDNTTKHTLDNVKVIPEVVINVVTYDMVEQMSLSSTEYAKGVNEFEKAGFTAVESEKIRPFRVKESPVQFECKVKQVIELGDQGGAGNLIIESRIDARRFGHEFGSGFPFLANNKTLCNQTAPQKFKSQKHFQKPATNFRIGRLDCIGHLISI